MEITTGQKIGEKEGNKKLREGWGMGGIGIEDKNGKEIGDNDGKGDWRERRYPVTKTEIKSWPLSICVHYGWDSENKL